MEKRHTAAKFIPGKLMVAFESTTIHFQITVKTPADLQFSSLTLVINMT
jgi:hypothetical protein